MPHTLGPGDAVPAMECFQVSWEISEWMDNWVLSLEERTRSSRSQEDSLMSFITG